MGLCERCKKTQATFHLTNISPEGEKTERHLCERCAVEEGLIQVQKPNISAEFIENFISAAKVAGPDLDVVCPKCGTSYVEFRNRGVLGCPRDYDVFEEWMMPLLERAHEGAYQHVGKVPKSLGFKPSHIRELRHLKRLLEEAVAGEDYERAAELRDRIRKLEQS